MRTIIRYLILSKVQLIRLIALLEFVCGSMYMPINLQIA